MTQVYAPRAAANAETLALLGIDDLAKFRIVTHLLTIPDIPRTAGQIADALGFRSPDRTNAALTQLVRAGILSIAANTNQGSSFVLSSEGAARLQASGALGSTLPAPTLHALADRSLARIRHRRRPDSSLWGETLHA